MASRGRKAAVAAAKQVVVEALGVHLAAAVEDDAPLGREEAAGLGRRDRLAGGDTGGGLRVDPTEYLRRAVYSVRVDPGAVVAGPVAAGDHDVAAFRRRGADRVRYLGGPYRLGAVPHLDDYSPLPGALRVVTLPRRLA